MEVWSAVQLTYAYREVDDAGVPLRRGFKEVATHIGMSEERCAVGRLTKFLSPALSACLHCASHCDDCVI